MTHADLFETIERVLPEGGDWCSIDRAETLAALVLALRPRTALEVGVWMGGSAVPIMLAMDHLTRKDGIARVFVAVDPWSTDASIEGQDPINAQWWGTVDHDVAFRAFCDRLTRHELTGMCRILRQTSGGVDFDRDVRPFVAPLTPIMAALDFVSIDGNHAEQAIADVKKFAPHIPPGGVLALDDVDWTGGHVARAKDIALAMGFSERYRVDRTAILQREEYR